MKPLKSNPLNYPPYVRGIPPASDSSFKDYTCIELEKIQNTMANLAIASSEDASAKVTTETFARVEADGALAGRIDTVETTVGEQSASISTLQSSVNGLELKYSVTLDSNGYVTGFEQNNNGKSGQFIIRADQFKVVSPGQNPSFVFSVDASGVHYNGKSTVSGLTTGVLNADMNVGSGRIIWDNGSYMKVAGVGFGSSNQFIEWFGPKMAISSCSEANAIYYLKTDGSAYFGGSLSAGTLKNGAETSSLSPNAYVEVGPFGSNGKAISVVTSYSYASYDERTYSADFSGVQAWESDASLYGYVPGPHNFYWNGSRSIPGTATVVLQRAVGGGPLVDVATLTISGGIETFDGYRPTPGDAQGNATITSIYYGSMTFNDTLYSTANRTFKAVLTSRSLTIRSHGQSQRIGIIATE